MSDFTRFGCAIWDWEPWTSLDPQARVLWLALYTSSEAKRIVPGLWHGGIPTLAEASRLQPDQVWTSLDTLLEHDLIEYDRKLRVIHLTVLPDAGERPMNGKHIMGWWNRFVTVPRCQVRDSHIRVLRWLIEQGTVTEDHERCWAKTFGDVSKVQIPPIRKRGVRRLVDDESDTSTAVQPSLFPSTVTEANTEQILVDLVPDRVITASPDTVSDTVSHTVYDTHTDTDTDPDLVSASGSGSGSSSSSQTPERGRVLPFPKDPDAAIRARLVNGFVARLNAARDRAATALRITGYRPCPLMGGEQTLLERLKESRDPEGDLEHVLKIAEAEAIERRELRWLSWSIAEPKSWRARVCATLPEVAGAAGKTDYRGFRDGESVFDVVNETATKLTEAMRKGDP